MKCPVCGNERVSSGTECGSTYEFVCRKCGHKFDFEEHAICEFCKQPMNTDSCIAVPVEIRRATAPNRRVLRILTQIKFGEEKRFDFPDMPEFIKDLEKKQERCHDCGVKKGGYHHPGCDWEECPGCHHQMLMCSGECG